MNTVGELAARMDELLAVSKVISDKLIALGIEADNLLKDHENTEQQRKVTAAGRHQWQVPDQPAISEKTAWINSITRTCSWCSYRHPVSFLHARNNAQYRGKEPPYNVTFCLGCNSRFL